MDNENLYQTVKSKICDEIFAGHYEDGDMLPSERELEKRLNVSRVTVRKSLQILEEDNLIVREVGRGTKVTLRNCGNPADMDMIVLIAPARNPFFSEFIGRFQRYAEKKGTLVLYVEKPRAEELENSLYRLYRRGLRNAVIWLEDLPVQEEKLRRLRAIGMNMVFFDSDRGYPYADCVTLDNELAIETLYKELRGRGYEKIGYIGWDKQEAYSIRMREKAYFSCAGAEAFCLRLPWKKKKESHAALKKRFAACRDVRPDAFICSDRECGVTAAEIIADGGMDIGLATVDELPAQLAGCAVMYRQDLYGTVEKIFTCLEEQCVSKSQWKADVYRVRGELRGW